MLAHILTAICIYLSVYGAAHVYFYFRLSRAFPAVQRHRLWATPLIVLMMSLPLIVMTGQGWLAEPLILTLHPIGFAWMGFIFLFCGVGLLGEFVLLFISLARFAILRRLAPAPARARTVVIVNLAVSLLLSVYAMIEAARPQVETVTIRTAKLPPGIDRLRIVHITDLHLGPTIRGARLDRIVRAIRDLEPDLIVSTGDLIDGRMGLPDRRLSEPLQALRPRYGKYACLGNHEIYAGEKASVEFTRAAGFYMLRDEGICVAGDLLSIVGISDPGHGISQHDSGEADAMIPPMFRRDRYLLLLKHRPEVAREALGIVDLQLSGHTHGGQMVPFNLVVRRVFPAPNGLSEAGRGTLLYVNRGLGTWGPPMRLFVPPEIAVIDLVRAP